MATRRVFIDEKLRESWNDDTNPRVVTLWDAAGAILPGYPRNYTAAEVAATDARIAAETIETNRAALIAKARAAQTTNATFLAINSPTTAQLQAQSKALTRQTNALIKLAVGDLADQAGT